MRFWTKHFQCELIFDLLKVNVADIPDIDGLRDKFNKCLPHAKADNNPEAGKWFEKANSILQGKTLQVRYATVVKITPSIQELSAAIHAWACDRRYSQAG